MPGTRNQNQIQEATAENSRDALTFEAVIKEHNPERGVLATADVKVGDFMTIRNVKIKEDDYGLTATMPRTKMPHTEQYKDSIFFADKGLKEQFDQAVTKAYQDSVLNPVLNDEGLDEAETEEQEDGMQMGMGM